MARSKAYGGRGQYGAPLGTDTFIFGDDGVVPNSKLPLIVRQGAVTPSSDDPARAFEQVFEKHGWTNGWRDGIFDYHHYHSTAHEVVGIAAGSATVRFGGENGGETIGLTAGDVVVIPAGVAHARISQSDDLLAVGAYAGGRDWDIVRDDPKALAAARERIAQVPLPAADPVDGESGPLTKLWRG